MKPEHVGNGVQFGNLHIPAQNVVIGVLDGSDLVSFEVRFESGDLWSIMQGYFHRVHPGDLSDNIYVYEYPRHAEFPDRGHGAVQKLANWEEFVDLYKEKICNRMCF